MLNTADGTAPTQMTTVKAIGDVTVLKLSRAKFDAQLGTVQV